MQMSLTAVIIISLVSRNFSPSYYLSLFSFFPSFFLPNSMEDGIRRVASLMVESAYNNHSRHIPIPTYALVAGRYTYTRLEHIFVNLFEYRVRPRYFSHSKPCSIVHWAALLFFEIPSPIAYFRGFYLTEGEWVGGG